MAKPDWLSIEEITRLWAEETGGDSSALRAELEVWFAEFVKQSPKSDSLMGRGNADSTNRLMGMLGARYLERSTFEAFCEERGYAMPRFWSGRRAEAPPRREPGQPPLIPSPSNDAPPAADDAPSPPASDRDADVEAFQAQIANLSSRLQTSHVEIPSFSEPPPADRPGGQSAYGASEPRTGPNPQELIDQAAAAKARELKAQLEAAEQQIADLSAEREASRAGPVGGPVGGPADGRSGPGSPEPDAPRQDPTTGIETSQQALVGYRGPDATGQLLRQESKRRQGRGRFVLMAGLAVSLVALLLWGAETVFEYTRTQQLAFELPIPLDGSGPEDRDQGQSPLAFENRAGSLDPETAGQPSDTSTTTASRQRDAEREGAVSGAPVTSDGQAAQNLLAAQREISRLNDAAEVSGLVVARLQAELALARRQVETARTSTPATADTQTGADGEEQRQDLLRAVSDASARADALQRNLEANRKQTAELTKVLETTNAERTELRAALTRAEEKIAVLGAELDGARTSTAEAESETIAANAETSRLEAENTRLADELAAAATEASRLSAQVESTEEQAARAESARDAAEAATEEAQTAATGAEQAAAALREELDATLESASKALESAEDARAETSRLRATLEQFESQAQTERRDLVLAATVSSARVADLQRELEAAQQQIAASRLASETASTDLSDLRAALEQTEKRATTAEQQAAAAETARQSVETAATEASMSLEAAEQEIAALSEQVDAAVGLATNVDKSLAAARAETDRLRTERARLSNELAAVTSDASRLEAALRLAESQAEARRQDLTLATTAASARVAALNRELETARQEIADLSGAVGSAEEEATRRREELTVHQQEAATARPAAARPAEATDQDPASAGEPEIEETLIAAETASGGGPTATDTLVTVAPDSVDGDLGSVPQTTPAPKTGRVGVSRTPPVPKAAPARTAPQQIVTLGPTDLVSEASSPLDTVAPDDLLLEPGDHVGHEVVVTGSVVWLLWRYRLQSDNGSGSMVIDVNSLQSTDQTVLKKAMKEVGLLGQVRARIKGIIERQGEQSYRLAASELVLVE